MCAQSPAVARNTTGYTQMVTQMGHLASAPGTPLQGKAGAGQELTVVAVVAPGVVVGVDHGAAASPQPLPAAPAGRWPGLTAAFYPLPPAPCPSPPRRTAGPRGGESRAPSHRPPPPRRQGPPRREGARGDGGRGSAVWGGPDVWGARRGWRWGGGSRPSWVGQGGWGTPRRCWEGLLRGRLCCRLSQL